MPIPSRGLPKPAGGYGERRRPSVFRAIRACIRGQLAPLSNFPYPNREQLLVRLVLTFSVACDILTHKLTYKD